VEPPNDEFEFDFFETDPATTEAQAPKGRLPRRGGSASRARMRTTPPSGMAPMLRLLGAVAVGVALLVVFGLAIQSCASTSAHDRYRGYMEAAATIAQSSSADGRAVAAALTTPGVKPADLDSKLSGIAEQERQNAAAAARLDPPGRLRPENTQLVEALQLRVSGTQGLADTFGATAASTSPDDAKLLLEQANRLLASDVVWSDLFLEPSKRVMQENGIVGVEAPESQFLASSALATQSYWTLVLQRLRGTATSSTTTVTGLHGTNIISTMAGSATLSSTTENTVTATTSLEFDVTVHNGGDSQEVGIPVTLTIQQPRGSIVKTQKIALINPGEQVVVKFTNLGVVQFAQKEQVVVDVAAVPHEHDTTNNHATYPVIFSLG